jgi:tetratricopeptide (TPR) repeat protein
MYTSQQYLEAGIYCTRLENWQMAVNPLQEALKMGLDTPELRMYLGQACIHLKLYREAHEHLTKSLELKPDYTYSDILLAHVESIFGKDDESWERDMRLMRNHPARPYPNRIWDCEGSLVGKTVLVHMFDGHGLGDVIQSMRHIAPFKEKFGCQILVSATPDTECLFKTLNGVDQLTVYVDETIKYDVSASLEDCRLLTRGMVTEHPYLYADPEVVSKWAPHTNKGLFRVGVSWRASQGNLHRTKSVPLRFFKPLTEIPGVELYSLQVRAGDECYQEKIPLVNIGGKFNANSFSDAAAATECMDLVISVDSAIAHLAGALGKQVWTLLPYAPASRWKLEGDTTEIYPTMRLFRQPSYGDWKGCFDKVTEALKEVVCGECVPA